MTLTVHNIVTEFVFLVMRNFKDSLCLLKTMRNLKVENYALFSSFTEIHSLGWQSLRLLWGLFNKR